MIHRYKIRINVPRGVNNTPITGVTTQPPFNRLLPVLNTSSSQTILAPTDNPSKLFTNTTTYLTSGTTVSQGNYKHLTIPINVEFNPTDYSDLIDNWVYTETRKAINKINNVETVKYTNFPGITIIFRFYDKTNNVYDDDFAHAGFLPNEIKFKRKNFRKSYFRLYFYDSNTGTTQNLLFTEDLDVLNTKIPQLPLDRLYWLRDDELFFNNTQDRKVYMEARFFNAKTGKVSRFINLPLAITTLLNVTAFSNPANHEWRSSPIKIKNPNGNLGKYSFETFPGVGANTVSTITLSEYILT